MNMQEVNVPQQLELPLPLPQPKVPSSKEVKEAKSGGKMVYAWVPPFCTAR